MKAVDPRLLRQGRPTRIYLATSVGLGTAKAVLLVAQAGLLATIITGAFMSGRDLAEMETPMALLLVVVVLRSLLSWASEWSANRCSAQVKSRLRGTLVRRGSVPGGDGQATTGSGELATLAARGWTPSMGILPVISLR